MSNTHSYEPTTTPVDIVKSTGDGGLGLAPGTYIIQNTATAPFANVYFRSQVSGDDDPTADEAALYLVPGEKIELTVDSSSQPIFVWKRPDTAGAIVVSGP